jgi:hypothetical protein
MMSLACERPAGGLVLARSEVLVKPFRLIWVGCVAGCRRQDRCDGRCGRGGRGWRQHRSGRRTRQNATISEWLPSRIRVIDATHPLFGQWLAVSADGASRRIGWIRVVLPDGRQRWIARKATDLDDAACGAGPNRGLPLVSVRTLLPLAEYVRARLSSAREEVDGTSGPAADPAVRTGIAGSLADPGPQGMADDDAASAAAIGAGLGATAAVGSGRS